jgi:radical SAM superfamily enzyme YgiQ (UPF0313 family)
VDELTDQRVKNFILSKDAIGINVQTANYVYANHICNLIKRFDPNIPIIIGGPHCSFLQERALQDIPQADICVIGDGEHVMVDIAQCLQGIKKLRDISGVFFKEKNIIKNGKALRVIEDLDTLPFPAHHLTDKYDYGIGTIFNTRLSKLKLTSMITSRGCPFKCRFCSRTGINWHQYGFRQRSAENIIKEFQAIDSKYGSVLIVDDNFLVDIKRANKIMDALIQNGTKIHLYILGARIDSANLELYKKMKKANVKFITYGIESGNQDVLDYYHKTITLDQIRKATKLSRKMGFITLGSFILGAPFETDRHIENTIKFACSLPIDLAQFNILGYQAGSILWEEAVKNKKISEEEMFIPASLHRGLGNFSLEKLEEYEQEATERFYLRPLYVINQIYQAFIRQNFVLLRNGIKILMTQKNSDTDRSI